MCLGIPGQIVSIIDADAPSAMVSVGGVQRAVNIACIIDEAHSPAQCIGDWVLVHVGFAMARIDALEAERTLAILAELGEMQSEIDAMRQGAGA
jgi:hydrogenase expression/formation protein HypC